MNKSQISSLVVKIFNTIRSQKYVGYDPYDALNSKWFSNSKSKYFNILATQVFVHSPFNLRGLVNVKKSHNPKAIALILSSICRLHYFKINDFSREINQLALLLVKIRSKKFANFSWGYNFPWQNKVRLLERNAPTIVNTSFVANSLLDAYCITKKELFLNVALSSKEFILNDLNITEFDDDICFSYTPYDSNLCHNANVLGAALLARLGQYSGDNELFSISKKAINFTVKRQDSDGKWSYNINPSNFKEKSQTDWHQGFILDSINDYVKYSKDKDNSYSQAIVTGVNFYYNKQFTSDGRCYFRYPRMWPIDIHNQAQGIITFSKLLKFKESMLEKIDKIVHWTIENMYDSDNSFYYQYWPKKINKINYLRWNQAWMLLALSYYIELLDESKFPEVLN